MSAIEQFDPALVDGLRRLKLRRIRQLAPEVCQTARTQRWRPEEVLRVLVSEEVKARDESGRLTRLKQAAFPVHKTLASFQVAASSLSQATFDYLASLEWIAAKENACFLGPAGTGKSHLLVALGHDPAGEHLAGTPRRVAHALAGELGWDGGRTEEEVRRFDEEANAEGIGLQ